MIPFAEHRPETVSEAVWVEYVRLMTAATYGKVTPPGFARLTEIYDQARRSSPPGVTWTSGRGVSHDRATGGA